MVRMCALVAGAVAVGTALLTGSAAAGPAMSGSLDPSFGTAGRTYADFGRHNLTQMANALAVQANGKVTAVGTLLTDQASQWDVTTWAVARWRADGKPDKGFGTKGRVVTALSDDVADSGRTVTLHDHGKVLVGGSSDGRFALVAYTSHGRLDTSWGGDGIVTTEIPTGVGSVLDVRVRADGSVIAAGYAGDRLAIARYRNDGALDTSYGVGGIVTSVQPFGGVVFGARLLPGGGLVATGRSAQDDPVMGVRTVKIDAAGLPDPGFGVDGAVTTAIGTTAASVGRSVVVQPDGRVVVAGSALGQDDRSHYLVLRYRTDGTLDPTFGGGDGYLYQVLGSDAVADDVVLQSDGRIVTAGWAGGTNPRRVVVARCTAAGRPDKTFHGTGYRAVGFGPRSYAEAHAVALGHGRIHVAGGVQYPSASKDSTFLAVRLRK